MLETKNSNSSDTKTKKILELFSFLQNITMQQNLLNSKIVNLKRHTLKIESTQIDKLLMTRTAKPQNMPTGANDVLELPA